LAQRVVTVLRVPTAPVVRAAQKAPSVLQASLDLQVQQAGALAEAVRMALLV